MRFIPPPIRPQLMNNAESRLQVTPLSPLNKDFIREVQGRHPHRTSVCGALLSEVASSGADVDSRSMAARLLGSLLCKRGLKVLTRILQDLHRVIETDEIDGSGHLDKPERDFLRAILIAVARMESPSSHALLEDCLNTFRSAHLRSDVLEAMAFEGAMFDMSLVAPFVADDTPEPMLLSALYALYVSPVASENSPLLKRLVAPCLEHGSVNVRVFAVEALSHHRDNLDLISALRDDPDPGVREAVAEALHQEYF